ncbi:MAG: ribosome biogenesis GTPase YlqF [Eubacteriaceae bacterium]|nr:ribosome biogenesis GTPase YlqF [Eubacteriaceae bacterium]
MDNINWYPGHMKKTREMIKENLKLVDLVVELIDARIPVSSRNPAIDQLTGDKPRLIILNKADLADEQASKKWADHFISRGSRAMAMNCVKGEGTKQLLKILEEIKNCRTGNKADKPFRMMVVGVPNVGKSSFINRMTGKKSTQTGDRPGVTKGKQWLTLKNGMQMLDTPGILWPKFEDRQVGLDLAFCGSIKDEILDTADLAFELIKRLSEDYPGLLQARYKLEEMGEGPLETMESIARKRGFIMAGKKIDYERCGRTVLDEFRAGTIGRITLEQVGYGQDEE